MYMCKHHHQQKEATYCLCEQPFLLKGKYGEGREKEKGMGKQFSPHPTFNSLCAISMHPLAGGNFCTCFFMLVVLLFLRQISKGPLSLVV